MKVNWNEKKNELEQLIRDKVPYERIGKIYGVSGNSIKNAAIKLGIILEKRRVINDTENFKHYGSRGNKISNVSDDEFIRIISESCGWREIADKLGYKSVNNVYVREAIKKRCEELGVEITLIPRTDVSLMTKGELFGNRKNWQSARTAIRKLVAFVYFSENQNPCCKICGYNKHVEVAHIKAVSEFPDSSTIGEIDSIDNLVGLCPNHHWEYDNGLLEL